MLTQSPGSGRLTPGNALTISDAYACIRVLADTAATLPLIVYRETARGRERYRSRTADLLDRPAPSVTQAGLVGQIVSQLATWGNCWLGKFRDEDGRIEQLFPLPPSAVTVELKGGVPIYTFTDPATGRQTTHTAADICHIKTLSTDGLVGLSPVRQCRVALGLSDRLARHAASFFENDAMPSGILKVGGSHKTAQEVAERWHEQHRGPDKAHRIAVVAGDIGFEPVTLSPEDAQFLGQRELSAVEVARVFRVPPWMIGAHSGDSMTYANVEMQSLAFVTFSLRPYLTAIEQALSADRDFFTAASYCEFLIDALLRADSATRAQVYTAGLDPNTGWLTREEVRRMENLPPEQEPSTHVPPSSNGRESMAAVA